MGFAHQGRGAQLLQMVSKLPRSTAPGQFALVVRTRFEPVASGLWALSKPSHACHATVWDPSCPRTTYRMVGAPFHLGR